MFFQGHREKMLTQECYLTEEDFCVIKKTIYYVNLFKSRFILIGAPFNFYFWKQAFFEFIPESEI